MTEDEPEHRYKRIVCNQSYFTKYDDLYCGLDNDLCNFRQFDNPDIKAMKKCYDIKIKIYQDEEKVRINNQDKFKSLEQIDKAILNFIYTMNKKGIKI